MMDGIKNSMIGLGSSSVVQLDATARSQRKGPAVQGSAVTNGMGKAELSPLAIAAHDAGSAPVDSARIEKLRAGIADGSYQVDHEQIAAKMIALDLGWAAKGE